MQIFDELYFENFERVKKEEDAKARAAAARAHAAAWGPASGADPYGAPYGAGGWDPAVMGGPPPGGHWEDPAGGPWEGGPGDGYGPPVGGGFRGRGGRGSRGRGGRRGGGGGGDPALMAPGMGAGGMMGGPPLASGQMLVLAPGAPAQPTPQTESGFAKYVLVRRAEHSYHATSVVQTCASAQCGPAAVQSCVC